MDWCDGGYGRDGCNRGNWILRCDRRYRGYRGNWRIWTHWCYRVYWMDGSCRYCIQYGCDRADRLEWGNGLHRSCRHGDEYRSDGAYGLHWANRLDRTRGNCHQYGCNR